MLAISICDHIVSLQYMTLPVQGALQLSLQPFLSWKRILHTLIAAPDCL